MTTDEYRDEFGFLGPLPTSSNQRRLPGADFTAGPDIGERFPDFSLADATGRRVALHRDRGDAQAAVAFLRSVVWSPACLTQLSELCDAWPGFEAAGVRLYVVSYDDRKALADAAATMAIPFPLLSDPSSAVIWRLGLLNTLLTPADVPFYGVAFPGAYLLDGAGTVAAKFFHRHMAMRTSAETLLDAATGRVSLADATPRAKATMDGARITVALHGGGGVIRMGAVRELVVRFELDDGLELCAPSADPGTHVSVSGPQGFQVGTPILPATSRDGDGLSPSRGTVDFRIPVWVNSEVVGITAPPSQDSARLEVGISLQLREKDGVLRPDQTLQIAIEAPIDTHLVPDLPEINATGHRIVAMESERHFRRLLRRAVCEEAS